jgi:hypothetical protein
MDVDAGVDAGNSGLNIMAAAAAAATPGFLPSDPRTWPDGTQVLIDGRTPAVMASEGGGGASGLFRVMVGPQAYTVSSERLSLNTGVTESDYISDVETANTLAGIKSSSVSWSEADVSELQTLRRTLVETLGYEQIALEQFKDNFLLWAAVGFEPLAAAAPVEAPPTEAAPAAAPETQDWYPVTPEQKNVVLTTLFPGGEVRPLPPIKCGLDILDEGPTNPLYCDVFFLMSVLTVLDPMCHDKLYPKKHARFPDHYSNIRNQFKVAFREVGCEELIPKFMSITANVNGDQSAKAIMAGLYSELTRKLGLQLREESYSYDDGGVLNFLNSLPTDTRFMFDSVRGHLKDIFPTVQGKNFYVRYSPLAGIDPGPKGTNYINDTTVRYDVVSEPQRTPTRAMPWATSETASWMDGTPTKSTTSPRVTHTMVFPHFGTVTATLNNRGASVSVIRKIVAELITLPRILPVNRVYSTFIIEISPDGKRARFTSTVKEETVKSKKSKSTSKKTAPQTLSAEPSGGGVFIVEFDVALLSNIPIATFIIATYKHLGDAGVLAACGFSLNVLLDMFIVHFSVEELAPTTPMGRQNTISARMRDDYIHVVYKGEPLLPDRERSSLIIDKINTSLDSGFCKWASRREGFERKSLTPRGRALFQEALNFGVRELDKYFIVKNINLDTSLYAKVLRLFIMRQLEDNIEMSLKYDDTFVDPRKLMGSLRSLGLLDSVYKDADSIYGALCKLDVSKVDDLVTGKYHQNSKDTSAERSQSFFEDVIGIDERSSKIATYYLTFIGRGSLTSRFNATGKTFTLEAEMIPEDEALRESEDVVTLKDFESILARDYKNYIATSFRGAAPEEIGKHLDRFLWKGLSTTLEDAAANAAFEEQSSKLAAAARRAAKGDAIPAPPRATRKEALNILERQTSIPTTHTTKQGPDGDPVPMEKQRVKDLRPGPKTGAIFAAKANIKKSRIADLKRPGVTGGTLKRSHQCPDCQQALADRRKRRTRRKRRHGEPKVTVEIVAL